MTKYNKQTAVGIFVFLGIVAISYMSIKLGNVTMFSDDYYTVNADFTNVAGLKVNAPVQIYGVEVGFVESITLNQKDGTAHLQLMIRKGVKLTDDAIASIKTSGLIGDKYVGISPGGVGDPVEDGGVLFDTQPAIDLEDLISKFAVGSV